MENDDYEVVEQRPYTGMVEPGQILTCMSATDPDVKSSWYVYRVFPVRTHFFAALVLLDLVLKYQNVAPIDMPDGLPIHIVRLDDDGVRSPAPEEVDAVALAFRMMEIRAAEGDILPPED